MERSQLGVMIGKNRKEITQDVENPVRITRISNQQINDIIEEARKLARYGDINLYKNLHFNL